MTAGQGPMTQQQNLENAVDVIIAAWNRDDTIERAVRSVANDACVRSVSVVDDASQDDTASQAEALCAELPKLKVLRQKVNGGPSAARNAALAISDAPWIAILKNILCGLLKLVLSFSELLGQVAKINVLQIIIKYLPVRETHHQFI